jgi:hypothetical protein
MDKNKDSIVEIFSGTPWEAEMVKSLLENAEIESFLKNSALKSYWYDPISSAGVKVMISSSDSERAKEIVDGYYKNLKTK